MHVIRRYVCTLLIIYMIGSIYSIAFSVAAQETYLEMIPNGKRMPSLLQIKDSGASAPFNKDLLDAKSRWTKKLCEKDSDGDGLSNGIELGDPCCSWKETGNLAYINGISDPNDPNDTVLNGIYENFECVAGIKKSSSSKKHVGLLVKPKIMEDDNKNNRESDFSRIQEATSSSNTIYQLWIICSILLLAIANTL